MVRGVNKATFPPQTPQNELITCNTTSEGCSIPPIAQSSSTHLQENYIDGSDSNGSGTGNQLQGKKLINTISIIATSPVLYIQRLRKRFEDGSNNTTKREKRDSFERGKARFINSEMGDNIQDNNTENESSTTTKSQERRNLEMIQESMFYPERKVHHKHKKHPKKIYNEDKLREKNIMTNSTGDYDMLKNETKISTYSVKNKPSKNSRSDVFDSDESNFDYIQTTKNDRGGSGHLSLFKNPVYDSSDDYDEDIILGGSHSQHDGTTPIPIVDADHDYDSEFEYVQIDNQGSRETEENENSSYNEANEDIPYQSSEEDNRGDEERDEDGSKEDESDGSEEIVKHPPVVVVYKGDPNEYQNSQIDPNIDIHERYITKDPLAGPGATRGFNHDFKILRGVPALGGVVIQPNTRFPTVKGFNTSEIHNIIKIGRLPGVTGIGPNFTKVGITPIEPARHAMPNDFGEYLGLHGLYGSSDPPRRPVMKKRPQYHGRRPLHNGYPVTSQRVVLRRPGTYRQPIRLSSQLSYPVRSRYRTHAYRPNNIGPKQLLRIKIIEDRSSDGNPEEAVKTTSKESLRRPTDENIYRQEEDHDDEENENEDKVDEQLQHRNSYDPTNKPYKHTYRPDKAHNDLDNGNEDKVDEQLQYRNSYDPTNKPYKHTYRPDKAHDNDDNENEDIVDEQLQDRNSDPKNKPYTVTTNKDPSHKPSRYINENENNSSSSYKEGRPKTNYKQALQMPSSEEKYKTKQKRIYRMKTPQIRRPKNPSKSRIYMSPYYDKKILSVSDNYNEDSLEERNYDSRKINNEKEAHNQNDEATTEGESYENSYGGREDEQPVESHSNEENEEIENSSTLRETSTEMNSDEGEKNDGSLHKKDEKDISRTLLKLIQRTEDLENDKMTPNGEEPISYNNFWTLEYSLPNFR